MKVTTAALKHHSKRDVLCCWRNGLWAVSRCIKKLQAASLHSLTSTLYAWLPPLFDFVCLIVFDVRVMAGTILPPNLKAS